MNVRPRVHYYDGGVACPRSLRRPLSAAGVHCGGRMSVAPPPLSHPRQRRSPLGAQESAFTTTATVRGRRSLWRAHVRRAAAALTPAPTPQPAWRAGGRAALPPTKSVASDAGVCHLVRSDPQNLPNFFLVRSGDRCEATLNVVHTYTDPERRLPTVITDDSGTISRTSCYDGA